MNFQRERVHDVIDEVLPLLQSHYNEVGFDKDKQIDPNWLAYQRMEECDFLRVFTVRLEGKLIGYNCFFLNKSLHHQHSLQAVQDVLFIDKEHRGFGRTFIDWCDQELKKENVQIVYSHIKAKHNFGKMLESLKYELVDLVYARQLTA